MFTIFFLPSASVEDGILYCNYYTYNITHYTIIITCHINIVSYNLFFFILTCSQASEMVYKVIRLWRWHIMQSRFEDLSSAVCRRWRIIQLFLFFLSYWTSLRNGLIRIGGSFIINLWWFHLSLWTIYKPTC